MSKRFPKQVWLIRSRDESQNRRAEVCRTPAIARRFADDPNWQVVEYQRIEGQPVPKRGGA